MRQVSPDEYHKAITAAKASRPAEDRWRVDVKDVEDYRHCKALLVSPGGSCVAVKENGDIVSVCKKKSDRSVKGRDLLTAAFASGGIKLDSFDGNWLFYTQTGPMPISWTPFNEQYSPEGWRKGIDKPEPVVFFARSDAAFHQENEEWYTFNHPQPDYDAAEKMRDAFINTQKGK